jgi:hypothetical protein
VEAAGSRANWEHLAENALALWALLVFTHRWCRSSTRVSVRRPNAERIVALNRQAAAEGCASFAVDDKSPVSRNLFELKSSMWEYPLRGRFAYCPVAQRDFRIRLLKSLRRKPGSL